ncbi:hypothetical protein CGRA01v4_13477 [Colletotrichum graminicola]|nr:hypothetical protein CGRA01v4_13477 [Colletotrichum graminicola]
MPAVVLKQPRHGDPCCNYRYRLFIKYIDIAAGGEGGNLRQAAHVTFATACRRYRRLLWRRKARQGS